MNSSGYTTLSYDTKKTDELIDTNIRKISNSLENYLPQAKFLKQRKWTNDITNYSISVTQDKIRQSILSQSLHSPKNQIQHSTVNSSFNQLDLSILNSLDLSLHKIHSFIESYSKHDPYICSFLSEIEKILANVQIELKRMDKSNFMISQQLNDKQNLQHYDLQQIFYFLIKEIVTETIQQRESIIQKMREDNIKMARQVQLTQTQLDQSKLKHERFTKQNSENFYKISQQIKQTINVQSQKQLNQIDHLKLLLNNSKNPMNWGFKNQQIQQIIPPAQNITSLVKIGLGNDKNNVNLKSPQLQTVFESEQNKILSIKLNLDEKQVSQKSNDNLLHLDRNSSQIETDDKQILTTSDLPDESKFEEVRKFFIQSDLTDLKCNKSQRQLNVAKKVTMQKAKLHTMFILQKPAHNKLQSINNISVPLPQKSQKMISNRNISLKTDSLAVSPTKLKTSQKQFNQSLAINYHHTKASSLVQEFFEFKEDKNDTSKINIQSEIAARQNNQQETPKIRTDFLQHSSDYHFYTLLLDMSKSEKSIQKVHKENIFFRFLSKIAGQEMHFREFLMNLTPEKYSNLFESIQHTMHNEYASLNMILKLKKIILSVQKMHSSLMLTDAFNTIINETCSVLSCDRASVFLIDPRRNELWTKVAKNSKPIRVPMGKGLVGIVAQTGEVLNILDVYQDSRFNQEIDKINKYRTKSVLCLPIKDQNSVHIIGVLQAINKNEGDFFTKEDEGLLQILAQLATAVLRNSLYHDEREVFHNSLKSLLYSGILLQQESSLKALMIRAQDILLNNFDAPQANLWVHDANTNQLVRYYLEDDQNNQALTDKIDVSLVQEQRCSSDQGIVGHIFQTCNSENILNAYQHQLFNGVIDLNTSMPVITIIIKSQLDQFDETNFRKVGVLQCINPKGLESLVFNQRKNNNNNNNNNNNGGDIPHAFYETLEYLGQIIGDNLKRFIINE